MSLVNATLDASGSYDSDGTIVRYEWDLDGDGTFETDAGNIPTIQRLFGTSGPRTVGVLVTDDSGATDVALQSIVVQNRAPTAAFAPQAIPAIVGAADRARLGRERRPRRHDHEPPVGLRQRRRPTSRARADRRRSRTSSRGPARTPSGCASPTTAATSATTTRDVVARRRPSRWSGADPLVTRPRHAGHVRSRRLDRPRRDGQHRQLRLGLRRRRHDRPDDADAARP